MVTTTGPLHGSLLLFMAKIILVFVFHCFLFFCISPTLIQDGCRRRCPQPFSAEQLLFCRTTRHQALELVSYACHYNTVQMSLVQI